MFYLRLVLVFAGIVALVLIGRAVLIPKSWGEYGYYRGGYIQEEASRDLVYGTNKSCEKCHEEIYELKAEGTHKRLSCEICHGPVTVHVKDGKKIGDMPVRKGDKQIELCLTCHAKVAGRPEKFPMIEHIKHLEELDVKLTHTCDQCHTVHEPLENMNIIKKMHELRTLKEEVSQ